MDKKETEKMKRSHIWPLILKEIREILRNRYLLFLLLVPPIIQLVILGAALDPQVHNVNIGVVDYDRSHESRDLLAAIAESRIFSKRTEFPSEKSIMADFDRGKMNIALIIPPNFARNVELHNPAPVQVLVDGTDAYTAGIAGSYIMSVLYHWHPSGAIGAADQMTSAVGSIAVNEGRKNEELMASSIGSASVSGDSHSEDEVSRNAAISAAGISISSQNSSELPATPPTMQMSRLIEARVLYLYNRGQVSSWLFIPGVLGATLTLTSTLVASAAILRERESGTIDQLLMTPAETWEILGAKVIPIMLFMLTDVVVAIGVSRLVFGLPFRGSIVAFGLGSLLYLLVGIGIGMLLGSLCRSQRQAQLTSFFINIPVILLSGTVVPRDSMPAGMKAISTIDPLRYYADIARGAILKGNDMHILWTDLVVLLIFAVATLTLSLVRFRRQTS